MSIRRFFFMSLALAVLAVGLHLAALGQFGRGSQTIARAVTLSESERTAARLEAGRYTSRGGVILYVGYAVALSSIGFLIASARKHEPAWRLLTIALLGFYVMLQFVLV
jgi:hypothetical protein